MKKYIRFTTILLSVITVIIFFCSCSKAESADISDYENEKIAISGLQKEDFNITVKELQNLECVTEKTNSTSDKIGKITATGPTLNTLCNKYNKNQTDFSSVKIVARDGYEIVLNKDFLKENDTIILSFSIDNKKLEQNQTPIRLIIPKSNSAYWISGVSKIIFEK